MDLAQVFSQLIRINDLDIWEGLTHVGCNQEVYADALRLFCRDLEKKCTSVSEFLKNENWRDFAAAIHAIKGGLAGIGAWRLAQKAKELEDAAGKEDYGFCREISGKLLEDIDRFSEALKSSVLFEKGTIEREQVSLDYLEKKLSDLYLYCSFGNSTEAETLAKELKTKSFGEEIDTTIDTICTHVENLDYHLALQMLDEQPYIKTKSSRF